MKARLPLAEVSPCRDCQAPCCADPTVFLTPHDVWRLSRTLGLPWRDFASAQPEERGWRFRLRQKPTGACVFLVELPGGWRRCGVRGLEPASCRVYPYHVQLTGEADYEAAVSARAACPESAARAFASRSVSLDEEIAEQALAERVLERWRAAGTTREAGELVSWSARIYDAVERLRDGARSTWQLAAYRLVDGFPAPSRAGRP